MGVDPAELWAGRSREKRLCSDEAAYQELRFAHPQGLPSSSSNTGGRILGGQLLRSGTSVAANYRAACRSRSRAEFVSKLGIVLEEADETNFWLELIQDAALFPHAKLSNLRKEANELVSIFVSSVRAAKDSPLQSDL